MRLLIYTAAIAVLLAALGLRIGILQNDFWNAQENISALQDENRDLSQRILQLEIHDCGMRQYEDYSVEPQTSDEARLRCVGVMTGEIVCDERIVSTELYLGNCRRRS